MATEILTRRGTGDPPNTTLAHGELAVDTAAGKLYVGDAATNTVELVGPNAPGQLWNEGTDPNDIVNTNSGNVGIGTPSPYNAGVGNATLTLNGNQLGALTFQEAGVDKYRIFCLGGDLIFRDDAGGEKMRITSAGQVGIGTTNPDFSLDVQNAGFTQARFENTADTTCRITFNNTGQPNNNFIAIGAKSADMYFQTNNTEQMRITSAGNVGINTTSPEVQLHVGGAPVIGLTGSDAAQIGNLASSNANLMFAGSTTTERIYIGATGNNLRLATDGTERVRIDTSGNMLVGTTTVYGLGTLIVSGVRASAAATFRRSADSTGGVVEFFQFNNQAGGIQTNGAGTAPTFYAASDARLKTNVQDMEGTLAQVLALRPVTFDWVEKEHGSSEGFIAQEVQQVWPDCVSEDDHPESDLLRVSGLGKVEARLVKAIQELHAEIEALKNQ